MTLGVDKLKQHCPRDRKLTIFIVLGFLLRLLPIAGELCQELIGAMPVEQVRNRQLEAHN